MKKFLTIVLILCIPTVAFSARQSPVDHGVVTSGVGWRVDPFGTGRMVYHNGYDIAVPVGTPVYPTQAGTVYFAGPHRGYGNLVAIQHGQGYVSFYGHNSQLLVKAGQQVDTGTVIALSGSTGRSTGPHVHYEIRHFAGYDKPKHEQLKQDVKVAVEKNVGNWVEDLVTGKGGTETEIRLPEDE